MSRRIIESCCLLTPVEMTLLFLIKSLSRDALAFSEKLRLQLYHVTKIYDYSANFKVGNVNNPSHFH